MYVCVCAVLLFCQKSFLTHLGTFCDLFAGFQIFARFKEVHPICNLRLKETLRGASVCPNYTFQFAKKDFSEDLNIKGYWKSLPHVEWLESSWELQISFFFFCFLFIFV